MAQSVETADQPDEHVRALDLQSALRAGTLSACELLMQTYRKIEEHNPVINAICTLEPIEKSLEQAAEIDRVRATGKPLPPLAGLPIAVKDLASTAGIRTTLGSKIFEHNVPDSDCLLVERLKAAGAIIIGKTNTPELGAGSHTFNAVFGATRNPYDNRLTAGGSSGGAAAALASGMVTLADGSDMGGSLRNPAAYCNVVGFRPSMGRIPTWPQASSRFARMAVEGPMARTVEDCALLLQALAGPDTRDPRSLLPGLPDLSENGLIKDPAGCRLGWAPQPAGLPVAPAITAVLSETVREFHAMGCQIDPIALDELSGAMPIFKTLRAAAYAMLAGELYQQSGDRMKLTLADNIRLGLEQTSADIYRAEMQRTVINGKLNTLFERYDYLLLPTTQVMPFPVEVEYPDIVEGVAMESYIDWMASCCILSPFDVPCISIPAGFSANGLPVGLQIVGRFGDDAGVLRLAYALQQRTGYWRQNAPEPSGNPA